MLFSFLNDSSPDILFYIHLADSMLDLIWDSLFRIENILMYLTHYKPSRLTRFHIVWHFMMTVYLNYIICLNVFMIVFGPS